MKKIFFFIAISLTFFAASTFAQGVKIGYTSASQVLPQMTEFKGIQTELETYSKVLETQAKAKQDEFQRKLAEYEKVANDLSQIMRTQRENELRQLQQSLQEFQQSAQKDLQEKEKVLLEPVYEKVNKAINDVAKENGYSFIFNAFDGTGTSNLLYANEDGDITPLVLKKLGITPAPKTTTGGK
jgi:outer membrane protein